MSVERIDPATGEVDTLTEAEARRLTERIRVALDRVAHSWADLAERITEAYQRRADLAMGYDSWAEYADAELRPSEGLAAEVRLQLAGMIQQLPSRAVAPLLGVTDRHARRLIAIQVGRDVPPEPEPTRTDEMREVLAAAEREARIVKLTGPESVTTPGKITGLDGKTYTRPEPKPSEPKRAALPPMVQSAGWELNKAVERIQRLAADDRFNTHKDEMAPHLRSHLQNAIEACQDLLDRINNNHTGR